MSLKIRVKIAPPRINPHFANANLGRILTPSQKLATRAKLEAGGLIFYEKSKVLS